ncbi:MAG: T9SS type A sorting domain-containing protein [Chitinophagaceae bacterium]|nr:T9SS type A sorting domain-containing protein [Chitinophagaceae bacterium]
MSKGFLIPFFNKTYWYIIGLKSETQTDGITNHKCSDISKLASGIYFVKIYTINDMVIEKFVKQ